MLAIEEAIQKMGYGHSKHLFRMSDIISCPEVSLHNKKILLELKPYAFYASDHRILAVFFDDLASRGEQEIKWKIWNAQFPIVVSDEGGNIVIYSGTTIANAENPLKHLDTVSLNACDEHFDYSYWNLKERIKNWKSEKSGNNLNNTLLDNLKYVVKKLQNDYKVSSANRLILRVLFIRYLIDRGVDLSFCEIYGNVDSARSRFLEIVREKEQFIKLTGKLKQRFNGNLFDTQNRHEWDEITPESLEMLHDFLSASSELETGQLLLFPFYDFNIIPIELVSSIYEILIGQNRKIKDKAYYTPEGLADYIVDKTVGRLLSEKQECRVFDPSCGSGIFLVKSLQRILERNADANGFIQDNTRICELLENNIFGIDLNEDAVDVTIFSLYSTLLDYKNPKNLDDFRLPRLKERNIFVGDFFEEAVSGAVKERSYDAILGNPPWGSVKQERYLRYCKEKNFSPPDNDISSAFFLRIMEIGGEETVCGLVMPSKMLYRKGGPSLELRRLWLESVQVQWILELSAVRMTLFPNATAPTAVLSFICRKSKLGHKIEYTSIKPNGYLRKFGIFFIEPDDTKYVPQEMLRIHDELWKVLVYGSFWDYELLEKLRSLPTIGDVINSNGMVCGGGIGMQTGQKDTSDLCGQKILRPKNTIGHFSVDVVLDVFDREKVRRRPVSALFKAPFVLVPKGGVDRKGKDFTFRAAYSSESFLYNASIIGIAGGPDQKKILLNLCGLLNSSFFSYLNIMRSSSIGIEREQFFIDELKNYPYACSERLVSLVREGIEGSMPLDELREKVNKCVFEMYGVENNPFVDFILNVRIPEIFKSYLPRKCTHEDMLSYSKTFQEVWNRHFSESGVYHSVSIYPNIKERYAAYSITLSMDGESDGVEIIPEAVEDVALLTHFSIFQLNDSFFQIKNVFRQTDDSIIIVKPNDAKYWHAAMAIKDSHKVINDILLGNDNGDGVRL